MINQARVVLRRIAVSSNDWPLNILRSNLMATSAKDVKRSFTTTDNNLLTYLDGPTKWSNVLRFKLFTVLLMYDNHSEWGQNKRNLGFKMYSWVNKRAPLNDC